MNKYKEGRMNHKMRTKNEIESEWLVHQRERDLNERKR